MKTVDSTEPNYKLGVGGVHFPLQPVKHIDSVYEESGFETLREMQERNFWNRCRHRFLLTAVNRYLPNSGELRSAIDLGGGAGGWVRYLAQNRPNEFGPLALAYSSTVALAFAESVLPNYAQRFHIDLMNLNMSEQWNVAFLLDVIEHLHDDLQAMKQAQEALRPGGYLFVTAPAFRQFWSYNDDIAHHLRRYRRRDFSRLAERSGLTLCDAR